MENTSSNLHNIALNNQGLTSKNQSAKDNIDAEVEEFRNYMDSKSIWKDLLDKEKIMNGADYKPIYSLSCYHFWIKSNVCFVSNYEIVYVSGSNIVKYNIETSKMKLYPINSDTWTTSIYSVKNIQGETLVILGQKSKVTKEKVKPQVFPQVEIVYLDGKDKVNPVFDMSYYMCSNYLITHSVILPDSDICITLLKNLETTSPEDILSGKAKDSNIDNKLFLFEYTTMTFLHQCHISAHIEKIVCINFHEFIVYGRFKAEYWVYLNSKKKVVREKVIYEDQENEITSITHLKHGGCAISISCFRIQLYNQNYALVQDLDIRDKLEFDRTKFKQILSNFNITIRNLLACNDILICFIQESKDILFFDINNIMTQRKKSEPHESSNNNMSKDESSVINISLKTKIKSNHIFTARTIVIPNNKCDKLLYIQGETITTKLIMIKDKSQKHKEKREKLKNPNEAPSIKINYFIYNFRLEEIYEIRTYMPNFPQKNGLDMIKTASMPLAKNSKLNNQEGGAITHNDSLTGFRNSDMMDDSPVHIRANRSMIINQPIDSYNRLSNGSLLFGINDDSQHKSNRSSMANIELMSHKSKGPNKNIIEFNKEILPFSSIGSPVKLMTISLNPKIIIIVFENKIKLIYKQKVSERNESIALMKSTSIINIEEEEQPSFELLLEMKLDIEPICLDISPYGNIYIISYGEYSYIYGILNKEIKEYVKINSFCKAVAFSQTGRYIAISRSQFINSNYSIAVLDSSTWELEYVISNLGHYANKIRFCSSDSILVASLEDNNIFGWKLNTAREVYQSPAFKDKENAKNKSIKDENLHFKNLEVTEKIVDFVYDSSLDTLAVIIEDKKVKFFVGRNDDRGFEFLTTEKYSCACLLKMMDIIIFGTENGYIHTFLWPPAKYTNKTFIDTPYFISKKLHISKVISLSVSSDSKYLYSCADDGSIIISHITIFSDGELISGANSLVYFDQANILPTKVYINYSQFTNITEAIYNDKVSKISNLKNEILGKNNEFTTRIEKCSTENLKKLQLKRSEINDDIECQRNKVKELEDSKETLSKNLKETRERQLALYNEEIRQIKAKYKAEKEILHEKTKKLGNLLKDVSNTYRLEEKNIEDSLSQVNKKIINNLDKMLEHLKEKETQINNFIEKRYSMYQKRLIALEEEYEAKLRDIEAKGKNEVESNQLRINELENSIKATNKKLKDYKEKIEEWDKNKKELDNNNIELMENLAANTVRLKNMSLLLNDNEKNISDQEKIVKYKREINARLEKLRFVLEYQITNLIKEKTPIEEQIKNFEELHNDFYKRFNQLYAEQLNIGDCIKENERLIEDFKNQLAIKKTSLYVLKNLYNSINLKIGFIFKDDINDKYLILTRLELIYKEHLENLEDDSNKKEVSNENKIQSKILEKEIKKQKNKVLTDLINKRKEIFDVKREKLDLMLSIQKENTLFIEQCTSIRLNLNDILKNINDIEKKFIELTNTHSYLNKDDHAKFIKEDLKSAKKTILLADSEGANRKRADDRRKKLVAEIEGVTKNEPNSFNTNKQDYLQSQLNSNFINFDNLNNELNQNTDLLKEFEKNHNDQFGQSKQVEKMGKRIKSLLASGSTPNSLGHPKMTELNLESGLLSNKNQNPGKKDEQGSDKTILVNLKNSKSKKKPLNHYKS